jgi:hypothetical protein
MNHLFVSYEIALLAKQKEYDEPCLGYYTHNEKLCRFGSTSNAVDIITETHQGLYYSYVLAPLYQQLVDWFRVKHNIQIQQAMPIPKEAVVAANGKLDHISQRYVFYIYNEYANPRIVGKDQRSDDYYEALKKAIEEAFKLI